MVAWLLAGAVLIAVCLAIGKAAARDEAPDAGSLAPVVVLGALRATPAPADGTSASGSSPPGRPTPRRRARSSLALLGSRRAAAPSRSSSSTRSTGRRRPSGSASRSARALALLAAALIVAGRAPGRRPRSSRRSTRRTPTPEDAGARSPRSSRESGSRLHAQAPARRAPAGAAGAALGAGAARARGLARPAVRHRPARRARRGGAAGALVDEDGRPDPPTTIDAGAFYTAFPEGADHEGDRPPVVVVRLDPTQLHLPAGRRGWAPDGIVAYSKICTHAGCAIALYRKPLFAPDRARAGARLPVPLLDVRPGHRRHGRCSGPAGRPLPQLPLEIDARGAPARRRQLLRARSARRWWGVRNREGRT